LVSSINKSINPCNDFYEFVCSGWKVNRLFQIKLKIFLKHNNPIEADKTSSNQFQLISNLIEKREKGERGIKVKLSFLYTGENLNVVSVGIRNVEIWNSERDIFLVYLWPKNPIDST